MFGHQARSPKQRKKTIRFASEFTPSLIARDIPVISPEGCRGQTRKAI